MRKILKLIVIACCVYFNSQGQTLISATIQDASNQASGAFYNAVSACLQHSDLSVEGKIKIVGSAEWTTQRSVSSRDNHFRIYGRYFCFFKINPAPDRNDGAKNLSVKMIDLLSDQEHIIFDRNILQDDIENVLNIIMNDHIQKLLNNSGWKQSLFVLDNQKDIICNNYIICFDKLYYDPQIYQRFYVQRNSEWPDEVRCTNADTLKGLIRFEYIKHNLRVGSPLVFPCDCKTSSDVTAHRKKLDKFFKIIIQ